MLCYTFYGIVNPDYGFNSLVSKKMCNLAHYFAVAICNGHASYIQHID